MSTAPRVLGAPIDRVDGSLEVTGAARYAYEHPVDGVAYAVVVQSTIARGRIVSVDATAAEALEGVVGVLWHENAPRMQTDDAEQRPAVLQPRAGGVPAPRGRTVRLAAAGGAAPRGRRDGRWLVGTGVAASAYPAGGGKATATIRALDGGRYRVQIDASDIGTGAWTVLTQIAANALEIAIDDVILEIGDTRLPRARPAGGSQGTASWGTAIVHAARKLRADGASEATADAGENPYAEQYAMYAHGAQFAEVRVDADTGEIRVPRTTGVFAVGRVLSAKTARSQLVGAMAWGVSMALLEESIVDPRYGDFVNADLAEYHLAVNADIGELDATWIDEDDPCVCSNAPARSRAASADRV